MIGIIANDPNELDLALESGLQCVEIRADLLLDAGISLNQILELVRQAKSKNLASLMTLRHASHGGRFFGNEEERIQINQKALEVGADLIDLEWTSEASEVMVQKQAPMVISYHDFVGFPHEEELNDLTRKMEALEPCAVKVVPRANTLSHSLQMLNWVRGAGTKISRIGFAMGIQGTSSRILTTVFGAPITYASLREAFAPGHLSMSELREIYQVQNLNQNSEIYALAGKEVKGSPLLESINCKLKIQNKNAVCVPLDTSNFDEILDLIKMLPFAGIQLTPPLIKHFKTRLAQSGSTHLPSIFQELS